MRYIYLQPVGEIGEELLNYLGTGLKEIFNYLCKIAMPLRVPENMYSAYRGQYNAARIIEEIAEKMPVEAEKLLGVVDADIFVAGTNFVFGVAIGNAAVISLYRLRPEFYGEKRNEPLFRERALKEAVHELGHTFGLVHCPDIRCVMHFSNRLADTDIKGADFCKECSATILPSLHHE